MIDGMESPIRYLFYVGNSQIGVDIPWPKLAIVKAWYVMWGWNVGTAGNFVGFIRGNTRPGVDEKVWPLFP